MLDNMFDYYKHNTLCKCSILTLKLFKIIKTYIMDSIAQTLSLTIEPLKRSIQNMMLPLLVVVKTMVVVFSLTDESCENFVWQCPVFFRRIPWQVSHTNCAGSVVFCNLCSPSSTHFVIIWLYNVQH